MDCPQPRGDGGSSLVDEDVGPVRSGYTVHPAGVTMRPQGATQDRCMATYDIILRGPLGAQILALVDEYDLDDVPAQVVLCGLSADLATLEAIVDRANALGVAVVRVRQNAEVTTPA
jgi:hypothetical protein